MKKDELSAFREALSANDWMKALDDLSERWPRVRTKAFANAVLEAIKASLKENKDSKKTNQGEVLFAAVVANLDEDAPRKAYAKWLIEQGNSWGEYILAELKGPKSNEERKRIEALYKAHREEWLDGLAAILGARYQFYRGFLQSVKAPKQPADENLALASHPLWGTVEELETNHYQLLVSPALCSVKRWETSSAKALAKVCAHTAALPVEKLELTTYNLEPLKAVRDRDFCVFPNLRKVALQCAPTYEALSVVLDATWFQAVEELSFSKLSSAFSVAEWVAFLNAGGRLKKVSFEFDGFSSGQGHIEIERGEKGTTFLQRCNRLTSTELLEGVWSTLRPKELAKVTIRSPFNWDFVFSSNVRALLSKYAPDAIIEDGVPY